MNRLGGASSPYLRQHAGNPVDWYPWGTEAFAKAKDEDKPLFVSIGYAACHWCHVMAHESFEDPAIARVLGDAFVSVKVDREERPDVDAVYMAAVQAMTGSGGWPMSVFCTPDGRPFYTGTYFPPSDRHGMPSFRRVLDAIADAWSERRDEVEAQARSLADALEHETRAVDRLAPLPPGDRPGWEAVSTRAVAALAQRFDPAWGGFGPAPKFPRPTLVELCLRAARRDGGGREHIPVAGGGADADRDGADGDNHDGVDAVDAMRMATTTLDAMAAGGIYDHLEGGFARYSTDARWLVPHFEKMLTDQALLLRAYLHAWQVTGAPTYLQVVRETIEFVTGSLSRSDGGLCASLDADAAGVEGGHATWTPAEVAAALSAARTETGDAADLAATVCDWWGVTEQGDFDGRTVLHRPLHGGLARPPEVEAARTALLAARRRRPQPARDDKVLTEWHAMFTAALAEAAWACGDGRWARRAVESAEYLFSSNRRADGRWLRSADSGVPAFAADYSWVVECATRLATSTGDPRWTERAEEAADGLLELFWDEARGGLFTSGRDAETLVVRPKDVVDGALPSANAAAATALLRLGALTGAARWTDAGTRIAELALPLAVTQPLAVADMLSALAFVEEGAQIVVAGDRADLLDAIRRRWLPDAVVAWGEPSRGPLWERREPGAAYVCRGFVCNRPASDVATLEAQLDHLVRGRR